MASLKCKCPECNLIFDAPAGATGSVPCPICDTRIALPAGSSTSAGPVPGGPLPPRAVMRPSLAAESSSSLARSAKATSLPASNGSRSAAPGKVSSARMNSGVATSAPYETTADANSDDPGPRGEADRRRLGALIFLGAIGICLLAGLVGAVVIAIAVTGPANDSKNDKSERTGANSSSSSGRIESSSGTGAESSGGSNPASSSEQSNAPQKYALPPELQEKVNSSIDKGRDFIYAGVKSGKTTGYFWEKPGGAAALLALTLLECGIPADDPVIIGAANEVRQRNRTSTSTYGMVTAILFLDRLGDPADEDLIRRMALRLIAGQLPDGRWTYFADGPPMSQPDEKKVLDYLIAAERNAEALDGKGTRDAAVDPSRLPDAARNWSVVNWIQKGWLADEKAPKKGDTSNTQFGLLGLWIARRHGIPVGPSLTFVEQYFRRSQQGDGSWEYASADTNNRWRASMTCAGVLGLAVGCGVRAGKNDSDQDNAMKNGLRYLASTIDAPRGPGGRIVGADAYSDLYFLWSLERAAVVYDLQQIGGKDWYRWAAEKLVATQKPDGSWQDRFFPEIDTAFSLLVLKRVNVARDLTSHLKKLINVKDLERAKD
jgi:hypothetical protein